MTEDEIQAAVYLDWTDNLAKLLVSANVAIATKPAMKYTPTEILRRISTDLRQVSDAMVDVLEDRYEGAKDPGFDQAAAADLVELVKTTQHNAVERLQTWADGKNPDEEAEPEEKTGMYL